MARQRKLTNRSKTKSASTPKTREERSVSFLERVQTDLENRQSLASLALGLLILVVVGALLFNYFTKSQGELGPSQQTTQNQPGTPDVTKENLPGKYTVKEGDTLFLIAERYYDDGFLYTSIAEANKLVNPDIIEVGQVIEIPKVSQATQNESPSSNTLNAAASPSPNLDRGTGGAANQTIWGETITGLSYTVQAGDWLSKIAGRAYGDIYAYERIAKANNVIDPNTIEPGTVLKIPR